MSMWTHIKQSWLFLVMGVISVCILFRVGSLATFMAPDSWIHVGIGRFILENRHIPDHQDISFKVIPVENQLVATSWLFDLLSYVLFLAGSWSVVSVLILLWFGIGWLIVFLGKELKIPQPLLLVLWLFSAVFVGIFWKLHPLVLVPAMLLILFFVYQRWVLKGKTLFILFPLVMWLWAQLAGEYIALGFGLLILICILESIYIICSRIWKLDFKRPNKQISPLIVWSVVSIGLTLINPHGIRLWLNIDNLRLLSGANKVYSSLSGILIAANSNYIRENISTYPYVIFLLLSLFSVVGFLIYVVRRGWNGFVSVTVFLPLLILSLSGYWWVRFVPFSGILLIVPFAWILTNLFWEKVFYKKIFLICCGLAFGITVFTIFFPPKALLLRLPQESERSLRSLHIEGNIATTPDISAYMFYVQYPRLANLDVMDLFFDEYESINVYSLLVPEQNSAFERFYRDQNINALLLSRSADYLIATTSKSPDWSLVYFDEDGFVYVRKTAVSNDYLRTRGFSAVTFGRSLGFDPEKSNEAILELERFVKLYPHAVLARGQLATVLRIQKRYADAERILKEIPDANWSFSVMVEMARLQAAKGECRLAEKWFILALDQRKETNVSKAVLDLAVLYAGCLHDIPKAEHYFKRYNSYPLPPDERERVRKVAKDFGVAIDEADSDNK